MLFNSLDFALFFFVVLALGQALRGVPTLQKLMLLAASYWFYGQWSWMYLELIMASTVVDYAIGLGMVRVRNPRRLLWVSLCANLGLLAFFKYANFLLGNANLAAELVDSTIRFAPLDLLLPVGISFYTFQSLSYTIDVYRGDSPPRRSLLDYSLFVAFWPQLVAGPIVRDGEFFAQLDGDRTVDLERMKHAIGLIALGLLKKVVLADNLALVVDPVYTDPGAHDGWDALIATYAFAFQIYFDFSGYTDIAIGCALALGFEFPKNFAHPYAATSMQDFWRRWHMTLSRWLRDYLYIALGGNRKGPSRTYANLMTTMLLGGLWHGASWNFVIWGGLHGTYLAIERALGIARDGRASDGRMTHLARVAFKPVQAVVTFHLVCFAWIFFRAADLSAATAIVRGIASIATAPSDAQVILLGFVAALWLAHAVNAWRPWEARLTTSRGPLLAATVTVVAVALVVFAPSGTTPFIYFQF